MPYLEAKNHNTSLHQDLKTEPMRCCHLLQK